MGKNAADVGYNIIMTNADKIRSMPKSDYVNSCSIISKGKNFATGKKGVSVTVL